MKPKIAVLYLLLFLVSCTDNSNITTSTKEIVIDMSNIKPDEISDIFSIEDTIMLEATSNSLLSDVSQIFVTKDKIFISDLLNDNVLCFEEDGKFIQKIGNKGRAGNEVIDLKSAYIDNNELYLYDFGGRKILKFDINGNFINNIPLTNSYNCISPLKRHDGFIAFNTYTNSDNNPKLTWLNHDYTPVKKSKEQLTSTTTFLYSFSMGDNSVIHWEMMNDTIYSIDNEINSKYFVNFIKYAFPDDLDINEKFEYYPKYADKVAGLIDNVIETEKYVTFNFSHNFHTYWAVFNKSSNDVKVFDLGRFNDLNTIKKVISYADGYFIGVYRPDLSSIDSNPYIVKFKIKEY